MRDRKQTRTHALWETGAAQEWLQQFDPADRPDAFLLLQSLRLVDRAAFEKEVVRRVHQARGGTRSRGTAALFAVREVDGLPELPPLAGSVDPKALLGVRQLRPTYFDSPDDTARPSAAGREAGIGSEGALANLLRNLQDDIGYGTFVDHPSIAMLRTARCRRLLLVDDFIGSGTRATNFVDAFHNNKSIRSWRSYKRLTVTIVAYAGTAKGIRRVERHPVVDNVVCGSVVAYGCPTWAAHQLEAVENLCRKYAPRTMKPGAALGYERMFSLMIFEHKCPNTAPAILWQRSRYWKPLFREAPQRGLAVWPIPDEQAEVERSKRALAALGQSRLSDSDWEKYVNPAGRKRLMVLAALARGLKKEEVISRFAEVSTDFCRQLILECVEAGWATTTRRPTPAGLRELENARRIGITSADAGVPPLRTEYYFPRSLRRVRRSS